MSVSQKVVSHPILTVVVFALFGIMSLYILSSVAIDLFPDMDNPVLMVNATYSNAGPESVEKSVTKVLESALISVSNLKDLTSTSSEGSCMIRLKFEYGTNLETAGNDVRDAIDRVERALPDAVDTPSIFKFDTSSMPILRIAVRGNRSAEDLKEIAEDYVQPRLEQATGVAQANVSGGRNKIIRVELSQNRLDAYNLTLTSVASSLSTQNLELGGGSISEGTKNYLVRTTGEYQSIDEIANTVVATKNGYDVRLADIGRVFAGYEDKSSAVYINGQPGVYVSVQKQSGSNTVKTADAVYAKIKEIQQILPADITMEIVSDETEQIRETINELLSSAWQGGLLAMLILFLFLRSVRSTLIMGISIPFSIMITLLAMHFADITLNMMTMTGLILGIGMIVDASIVILENIYKYRERGTKPAVSAVLGTQEMMSSVISGNLTTICVFIPFIFFQSQLGMIGQLFQDMIFTIVIALLSSLLVALFLVPVLTSRFLVISTRKEKPLKKKFLIAADNVGAGIINKLTAVYRKGLQVVLMHRLTAVFVVVALLVLSVAMLPRMNISLMPGFRDSSVTLNVTMPIGTKLSETEEVMTRFESIAKEELHGIKTIITSVGSGSGGRSNATYTGSLSLQLPDAAEQIDSAETIKRKLRAHFDEFPNAVCSFGQGWAQQMSGGSDIDIAIRTTDLSSGLIVANNLVDMMKKQIPDVSEASIDMNEGLPQVEIVIDRDRAYSFGVTVTQVAREINACIDGTTATVYRNAGKEYNVVVMLQPSDRSQVIDLEHIYVTGTSGRIAIANFAQVEKGVGPVSIERENQNRIIHVTADIITDVRADKVEAEIQNAMNSSIILPDGVTASFEGSWKDIKEQVGVFTLIITMAILLVFGVMAGTYESFKDPLINLFTIPMMVIGVVAIYLITGKTLSTFTAIGVVMLAGIVVNNGIILVDYTNLLVNRGVPVHQACLDAGASRLRPVLMTTLTTILGMIPMAFFASGTSSMIQPIGLTVIGGLTSSTLITLFIIPVVYSLINERKHLKNKKEVISCAVQK